MAYDGKLNGQAWPFGPSDGGSDSNDSWGSGGHQTLVRQRLRNFMVALILARGVPMMCSGAPAGVNPHLVFTTYLTALRRSHPGLRQRSYGDADSAART